MRNRRIGVLMGGLSSETQVSIETGQAVLGALLERGYPAQPIFVDRDLDLVLRQRRLDAAFLCLRGRYGEDGCIQGLLETIGVPYTGSGVLASALAMHKVKAKELFRLHGVATPAYYTLAATRAGRHGDIGFPAVVKPVGQGSSVGVEIVDSAAELAAACERALCFDDEVLVERFVAGQEISVAVLEDRALGAVEVVPRADFYDYASKYGAARCDYFSPPRVTPARYRTLLHQAERAHRALGASGVTRVDLIVDERGAAQVLEVNTAPSLSPTGLVAKIADAAGLPFGDLVEAILSGARLQAAGRGNGERRIAQRSYAGAERRVGGAIEHH